MEFCITKVKFSNNNLMKIAIDVMGGDNSPAADIDAIFEYIENIENPPIHFLLVGKQSVIQQYLENKPKNKHHHHFISIIDAPEKICKDDKPSRIFKTKPNSSIVKAIQLLKENQADAVVSSGDTGVLLSTSLFLIGKIDSIKRPALAPYIPSLKKGFILCDAGANVDTKPEHLVQFAIMSQCYLRNISNIKNPKIGLLNIGKEANKGNELTKQVYPLLKKEFKDAFIGNIEARYLFNENIDIIVCDGFTGNITLKLIEGMFSNINNWIKERIENYSDENTMNHFDYENYGGTPLLGIKGIVIKSHGASSKKSILSSLKTAISLYDQRLIENIENGILDKIKNEV